MEFKYFIVLFLGISAVKACTEEEQALCTLPDCFCPGIDPPKGLGPKDIPQIVYLTFDDAITIQNYPLYQDLFFERVNPNGHKVSLTFFVTHEYNDYNLVHQLYRKGHDIAMHSISHQTNTQYWRELSEQGWEKEFLGQRQQLSQFAKIPIDSIQGMRAPFLQTGGDTMLKVISRELKYDCSRPTRIYLNPGLWPHTLDFDTLFQDCQIEPCSRDSYPGFWNQPMVDLTGGDGFPCAMLDTCLPQPNTTDGVFDLLQRNFLNHYDGNRAPFGVYTHAAWLADTFPGHKDGYIKFLDYLGTLSDVFIVSIPRGLEWVKAPTTLDTINDFAPWHVTELADACSTKYSCYYKPEDTPFNSERYMTSCVTCPRKYPWLDNPLGQTYANKYDRN